MNILVADDHKVMRQGLKVLLEYDSEFGTIYEAENGQQAIDICKNNTVDIVLMDFSMPVCNGIDAMVAIKERDESIKIIMISGYCESEVVKSAFAAGADGFLHKNCNFDEVLKAIKNVYDGQNYVSSLITSFLISDITNTSINSNPDRLISLSNRERLVLQKIAEGARSKEIANEMNVGLRTIERTRSIIMDKLDIPSVAGLTKYAVRVGLTTLNS